MEEDQITISKLDGNCLKILNKSEVEKMNKLYTDVAYIQCMNALGEHLQEKYGLTLSQVQGIKHKMHLVIEEMIEK